MVKVMIFLVEPFHKSLKCEDGRLTPGPIVVNTSKFTGTPTSFNRMADYRVIYNNHKNPQVEVN